MWHSQAGQDKWVLNALPITDGYFVEVGAYDGIQTSNTYSLELAGWKGVCIEANPDVFRRLQSNRTSVNIHAAATGRAGDCQFAGDRIVGSGGARVRTATLTDLLVEAGAPSYIDYLSIDIEGGELEALSALDFSRFHVSLLTVEHNLYAVGPEPKAHIFELLTAQGFRRVVEDAPCLDPNPLYFGKPYEDWFMNEAFLASYSERFPHMSAPVP